MKGEVFNHLYVEFFKEVYHISIDFESKQQIRTSQWKTICTKIISQKRKLQPTPYVSPLVLLQEVPLAIATLRLHFPQCVTLCTLYKCLLGSKCTGSIQVKKYIPTFVAFKTFLEILLQIKVDL